MQDNISNSKTSDTNFFKEPVWWLDDEEVISNIRRQHDELTQALWDLEKVKVKCAAEVESVKSEISERILRSNREYIKAVRQITEHESNNHTHLKNTFYPHNSDSLDYEISEAHKKTINLLVPPSLSPQWSPSRLKARLMNAQKSSNSSISPRNASKNVKPSPPLVSLPNNQYGAILNGIHNALISPPVTSIPSNVNILTTNTSNNNLNNFNGILSYQQQQTTNNNNSSYDEQAGDNNGDSLNTIIHSQERKNYNVNHLNVISGDGPKSSNTLNPHTNLSSHVSMNSYASNNSHNNIGPHRTTTTNSNNYYTWNFLNTSDSSSVNSQASRDVLYPKVIDSAIPQGNEMINQLGDMAVEINKPSSSIQPKEKKFFKDEPPLVLDQLQMDEINIFTKILSNTMHPNYENKRQISPFFNSNNNNLHSSNTTAVEPKIGYNTDFSIKDLVKNQTQPANAAINNVVNIQKFSNDINLHHRQSDNKKDFVSGFGASVSFGDLLASSPNGNQQIFNQNNTNLYSEMGASDLDSKLGSLQRHTTLHSTNIGDDFDEIRASGQFTARNGSILSVSTSKNPRISNGNGANSTIVDDVTTFADLEYSLEALKRKAAEVKMNQFKLTNDQVSNILNSGESAHEDISTAQRINELLRLEEQTKAELRVASSALEKGNDGLLSKLIDDNSISNLNMMKRNSATNVRPVNKFSDLLMTYDIRNSNSSSITFNDNPLSNIDPRFVPVGKSLPEDQVYNNQQYHICSAADQKEGIRSSSAKRTVSSGYAMNVAEMAFDDASKRLLNYTMQNDNINNKYISVQGAGACISETSRNLNAMPTCERQSSISLPSTSSGFPAFLSSSFNSSTSKPASEEFVFKRNNDSENLMSNHSHFPIFNRENGNISADDAFNAAMFAIAEATKASNLLRNLANGNLNEQHINETAQHTTKQNKLERNKIVEGNDKKLKSNSAFIQRKSSLQPNSTLQSKKQSAINTTTKNETRNSNRRPSTSRKSEGISHLSSPVANNIITGLNNSKAPFTNRTSRSAVTAVSPPNFRAINEATSNNNISHAMVGVTPPVPTAYRSPANYNRNVKGEGSLNISSSTAQKNQDYKENSSEIISYMLNKDLERMKNELLQNLVEGSPDISVSSLDNNNINNNNNALGLKLNSSDRSPQVFFSSFSHLKSHDEEVLPGFDVNRNAFDSNLNSQGFDQAGEQGTGNKSISSWLNSTSQRNTFDLLSTITDNYSKIETDNDFALSSNSRFEQHKQQQSNNNIIDGFADKTEGGDDIMMSPFAATPYSTLGKSLGPEYQAPVSENIINDVVNLNGNSSMSIRSEKMQNLIKEQQLRLEQLTSILKSLCASSVPLSSPLNMNGDVTSSNFQRNSNNMNWNHFLQLTPSATISPFDDANNNVSPSRLPPSVRKVSPNIPSGSHALHDHHASSLASSGASGVNYRQFAAPKRLASGMTAKANGKAGAELGVSLRNPASNNHANNILSKNKAVPSGKVIDKNNGSITVAPKAKIGVAKAKAKSINWKYSKWSDIQLLTEIMRKCLSSLTEDLVKKAISAPYGNGPIALKMMKEKGAPENAKMIFEMLGILTGLKDMSWNKVKLHASGRNWFSEKITQLCDSEYLELNIALNQYKLIRKYILSPSFSPSQTQNSSSFVDREKLKNTTNNNRMSSKISPTAASLGAVFSVLASSPYEADTPETTFAQLGLFCSCLGALLCRLPKFSHLGGVKIGLPAEVFELRDMGNDSINYLKVSPDVIKGKILLDEKPQQNLQLRDMTDTEISNVHNLTLERFGVGSITFPGVIDCSSIRSLALSNAFDFRKIVNVRVGGVEFVPPEDIPHVLVEVLKDRPAIITLHQIWPHISALEGIEEALLLFTERIRMKTEQRGHNFIKYDPLVGEWSFEVSNIWSE